MTKHQCCLFPPHPLSHSPFFFIIFFHSTSILSSFLWWPYERWKKEKASREWFESVKMKPSKTFKLSYHNQLSVCLLIIPTRFLNLLLKFFTGWPFFLPLYCTYFCCICKLLIVWKSSRDMGILCTGAYSLSLSFCYDLSECKYIPKNCLASSSLSEYCS